MARFFLFGALLLMIAHAVSMYRIDPAWEIMAGFPMLRNAIIVGGVGLTALVVAYRFARRRWRPEYSVLGFFCLVVVPVLGGPSLAIGVLMLLREIYSSEWFAGAYRARLDLAVEPLERSLEYDCELLYTNRYRITAGRDVNLVFSVDDRAAPYTSSEHADELYYAAVASQFAYLEQADSGRSIKDIGLFAVPQGTYIVELTAPGPYTLRVFYPEPLWTPNFFLQGEVDYAPVYGDDLEKIDMAALPGRLHHPLCDPAWPARAVGPPTVPAQLPVQGAAAAPAASPSFYLNDYVYITNAKINLFDGSDTYLYLYNQWPGNSWLDESRLLRIGGDPEPVPDAPDRFLWRTVTNRHTGQEVNIYGRIVKKDDPARPPDVPYVDPYAFAAQVQGKSPLTYEELLYLHRTEAHFWLDRPLYWATTTLNFNTHILPFNVEKVAEIVETIAPARNYREAPRASEFAP